jgi:hypothetical protein
LALLAFLVILLAAMPWHRPHPNHQFMLELLRSALQDEEASSHGSAQESGSTAPPSAGPFVG